MQAPQQQRHAAHEVEQNHTSHFFDSGSKHTG
jgi:hypothetical protein